MLEFFRQVVRKEFKVWGEKYVICNLLRYFFFILIERIRSYYLEDSKKCFGKRVISIFEMFNGSCFLWVWDNCRDVVMKSNFLILLGVKVVDSFELLEIKEEELLQKLQIGK